MVLTFPEWISCRSQYTYTCWYIRVCAFVFVFLTARCRMVVTSGYHYYTISARCFYLSGTYSSILFSVFSAFTFRPVKVTTDRPKDDTASMDKNKYRETTRTVPCTLHTLLLLMGHRSVVHVTGVRQTAVSTCVFFPSCCGHISTALLLKLQSSMRSSSSTALVPNSSSVYE